MQKKIPSTRAVKSWKHSLKAAVGSNEVFCFPVEFGKCIGKVAWNREPLSNDQAYPLQSLKSPEVAFRRPTYTIAFCAKNYRPVPVTKKTHRASTHPCRQTIDLLAVQLTPKPYHLKTVCFQARMIILSPIQPHKIPRFSMKWNFKACIWNVGNLN